MDVVLLFPGQGSQKPGMGKDVAEAHPAARAVFAAVDDALGEPLSALCFDGPADALTLTHNAQPALFAHGAAVWAVVRDRLGPHVKATAGHSLGEFTAYHAAGALSAADGARLVRRRGDLMFESGQKRPGTMAAILGALTTPLETICADVTATTGCVVPANYNSPGQVVISGDIAAVERAMELCKAAGAKRAIRLQVSGAFHSPLMSQARDAFGTALSSVELADPAVPVYANVTAEPVLTATAARPLLVEQITAPVRWTQLIERVTADHPNALLVEMGPGAVLVGLAKKIAPSARAIPCGTVAEIEHLLATAA
jgi:[acyl-carrier-protein] S-malonyltransferase